MQLILGSQSPRRKEILSYFSLPFEVISPDFDERSIEFNGSPVDYVSTISQGKAEVLAKNHRERLIITADTTVYRHGKVYGKPTDENDAIATLTELAGQWHSVFTAITLQQGTKQQTRTEETRVLFNPLTRQQIDLYHQQLHLYDKAGSYQLQMAGGIVINRIDGCYYNVVGMPINSVRILLNEFGVDLWNWLKK